MLKKEFVTLIWSPLCMSNIYQSPEVWPVYLRHRVCLQPYLHTLADVWPMCSPTLRTQRSFRCRLRVHGHCPGACGLNPVNVWNSSILLIWGQRLWFEKDSSKRKNKEDFTTSMILSENLPLVGFWLSDIECLAVYINWPIWNQILVLVLPSCEVLQRHHAGYALPLANALCLIKET